MGTRVKRHLGLVFAVAFSVLILGLSSSQNAYAGVPFDSHVWSAGGANDNWDNSDNWFARNVPPSTSDPAFDGTIYIGCDFAPTPVGEGPAPTNVNAVLNVDQDVVSPNNDGLMLCQGSTLTINEDRRLRIINEPPTSPISVSHTNAGNLIVIGSFKVQNTADNDDDVIVTLVNTGTITVDGSSAEFKVQNTGEVTGTGAVFLDIIVTIDNDGTITIIEDGGEVALQNTGTVTDTTFTTEVVVKLENDGTMTISDSFKMQNTGPITNDMGDGIDLDIIVDNPGDITVGGTFTMQNTGLITVTDPDDAGEGDFGGGNEVNIKFEENGGTLTILDDGEVKMLNTGEILGDLNPDLDIEFDDNSGKIDIKSGGKLLMENTKDLTKTDDIGDSEEDNAQVEIQFQDNNGSVLNAGTLEMKNSGNVVGPCESDISVEFNENLGLLDNSGIILLENTGDSTDTVCNGESSEIEVEIENDSEGGSAATVINQEGATITLKNSGNAEIIDVELQNKDVGLVTNRGTFNIENTGDATEELDVGIDNDNSATGTINNHCGGIFDIKNTDGSADVEDVGVANAGTINNFLFGLITVNDAGAITENEAIVVDGDPINFIKACFDDTPNNDVLYSCSGAAKEEVDPDDILRQIDPDTAETILEIPLIPPEGFELDERGCTALSPGAPRNQLYSAYRICEIDGDCSSKDRHLVTIDPNSGEMTDIGLFDEIGIAGLAFGSGELFAVTGDISSGGGTPETLFTVDTSDASTTEVCKFGEGDDGEEIAFSTKDDRIYHASGFTTFESTDTSDVAGICSVEDHGLEGPLDEKEVTSMTYWESRDIFMVASFDDLYKISRPESAGVSVFIGDLDHLSGGLAFLKPFSSTSGASGHEPPTIGKSLDGVRQVVNGGMSIDGQIWTVTQPYHQEFELLQMLSSPHTISNVIHCDRGVQYCNYIAVGFMGLFDDFNNPVMTVSASKDHLGSWTLGWFDPDDFISDPDDAVAGDIVFVPQIIDNKLLGTSFTIDFKNKDTGQLKLGIQVRDSYNGVRNFYFNEGVEFIDADAYPAVETAYESPIEVEPLCFGQNNPDRNSCAFAKIKDWATQNAEETLRQMMGNQYQYEQ